MTPFLILLGTFFLTLGLLRTAVHLSTLLRRLSWDWGEWGWTDVWLAWLCFLLVLGILFF